jgi:hypothetical protein
MRKAFLEYADECKKDRNERCAKTSERNQCSSYCGGMICCAQVVVLGSQRELAQQEKRKLPVGTPIAAVSSCRYNSHPRRGTLKSLIVG